MTIEAYTAPQIEEYRPRILMAPEDAKALDDQLRANQLAVLREGVDYGPIPGAGDKKNLLKPGAEKLIQWFGFGFTNDCTGIERDEDGRKVGVTYRCTITKGLPDGRTVTVATCEGYAGYDEERYYQTAEQAWAKECANAERYKRQPRKAKAVEYRAPWNTVLKMAQKRALVGAAIDATAAAGLFTQDLEDMPQPAVSDDDARAGNGQPAGDTWENSTPAPRRQDHPDGNGRQDGTPSWADAAIEEASSFKTEAAGQKLWREAAAAARDGRCTPGQATHVQNIITARIADRRKEAATRILKPLADDDPWRGKILEELGSDEEARGALAEVQQLVGSGQMDDDRSGLLGRAVIARFPKAAVKDPEAAP